MMSVNKFATQKLMFNLDKIFEIIKEPKNMSVEQEITNIYNNDEESQKMVRQLQRNDTVNSFRFDLVSSLIYKVLDNNSLDYDEEQNAYYYTPSTAGELIAFNTLCEYGLIIKIEEN